MGEVCAVVAVPNVLECDIHGFSHWLSVSHYRYLLCLCALLLHSAERLPDGRVISPRFVWQLPMTRLVVHQAANTHRHDCQCYTCMFHSLNITETVWDSRGGLRASITCRCDTPSIRYHALVHVRYSSGLLLSYIHRCYSQSS